MIIFLGNTHSLSLYQDFIESNKNCTPDIVVSCQYPHKIPDSLIESHTCVNIHYGLLPKYAGCNPIYWQMVNEDTAGVTLHYVSSTMDGGDIIDTYELPIGTATANEVYEALARAGKSLLSRHLRGIQTQTAPRTPQDLTKRKYFPKTAIDFKYAKHLGDFDYLPDKQLRALTFPGKQYPIIRIKGRDYEIRAL